MLRRVPLKSATDRTAEKILRVCFKRRLSAQQVRFADVLDCAVCMQMGTVGLLFGWLSQALYTYVK